MDKTNLTRKVSDGGYKLLASQGAKHAVYSKENGRTLLFIEGKTTRILHDDLLHVARSRGIIRPSTSSMEASSIISDLISDSLTPLTEDREDEIVRKAPRFLSCFAQDASWATSTPESNFSVPFNHHDQTQGPKKPDGATPETVFLRQRFHNLRVEFRISNTGYEIRDALAQHGAKGQPLLLNSTWNLFLRTGKGASTANPLVASGSFEDTLTSNPDGCPLILHRKWIVERISSPSDLNPERLRLLPLEDSKSPLGVAQRHVKDFLREAGATMQSLVALSALLASINPILDVILHGHAAIIAKVVVSSIGSLLAVLSVVVMIGQKVVSALDGATGFGSLLGGEPDGACVKESDITDGSVLPDSHGDFWEGLTNLREDVNALQQSFQHGGPSHTASSTGSASSDATKVVGDELV